MERDEFEKMAQEVFDALPGKFRTAIENVRIVVDDGDPRQRMRSGGYQPRGILLGLYEGVPLNRRGTGYGMYPVVPDTITLFSQSIGMIAHSEEEIRAVVRDTLIHEIGHYFGMTEREIRNAGY